METKRILVCAAATAVSALAFAQAAGGAAAGGARDRSNIIINEPGGQSATGLQGGSTVDRDPVSGDANPAPIAPKVGGPPIDVAPPQQKNTVGATPTTDQNRVTLPPPGTVTGQPLPGANTTTGTGSVNSSSNGTAGSGVVSAPSGSANTGTGTNTNGVVQPLPRQPGGAAIITAPSGVLQNNQNTVKGGFGSNDPNINATANVPVDPGLDASSQVDVTRRTQQLSQQTLSGAQPAGSTLAPSTQPTNRPVPQGGRIDIPMPAAPGQTGASGGFGGSTGGTR
jgi:hypothetical protein